MRGYSYEFLNRVRALAKSSSAPKGSKLGLKAIERGISVSYIAKAVGVSRMAVYDWFTGRYEPSAAHMEKLVAVIKSK
jgi:predicted transcriptional regulator